MTDELDALKSALKSVPAPSDAARAAALDAALRSFDETGQPAKEMQGDARPRRDRRVGAGILRGCLSMLSTLTSKPALAAATSAAALGLALVVVLPPSGPIEPRIVAPQAKVWAPAADQASEAAGLADTGQPAVATAPPFADPAARTLPAPVVEPVVGGPAPPATRNDAGNVGPAPNPVQVTAEAPVSTFAAEVDTASYPMVRSSLLAGHLPNPDEVRVEEMVNYFPFAYPAPVAGTAPFRPAVTVFPTPWNSGTRLVRIALQGRLPDLSDRPPLNLVLLIDSSGSMEAADKLPLLKQALGLMLGQLRPEDQVAIVAYAGSAGEVLAPTPASERAAILTAMDRLVAGGGTDGGQGLALAYDLASQMTQAGEVSRVVLATDGDFNLGLANPADLAAYVARKRDLGIYLSVIGFGRNGIDDSVMQALAQNGNGTASHIDTLREARKVLVDQLSGALFPIADDVKIQIEWNPATVAEYRMIGYETRLLDRAAFNNDRIDAGEIGAGHQVTALYEITAPDSAARLTDPLRYAPATVPSNSATAQDLGFLRLRYKFPGETSSNLLEQPIRDDIQQDDPEARFAAAIAGFGQLLRGSDHLGNWGWDQVIALAVANQGDDPFGYRAEAIELMRLARDLDR